MDTLTLTYTPSLGEGTVYLLHTNVAHEKLTWHVFYNRTQQTNIYFEGTKNFVSEQPQNYGIWQMCDVMSRIN